MRRSIFLILVVIIGFTSCKVGPNYVRPEYKSPDAFRFNESTPDSVLNLKWWELFNNDELNGMIKRALVNNQDILIAASRIEEARANLGYNKASQYPQIGYSGNASRGLSNVPGSGVQGPFNDFAATAQLAWELDFWGKYRRATEAAQAELLATEYAHRVVQLAIISETTQLYFLLLDYHSRLQISIKTLESRKESSRIIGERFDKGIVPELDLNQAQIQEAIAEAAVPTYQRLIAQTENALSIILGENPKSIHPVHSLADQTQIPVIPNGIPSVIMERRPDVLQAEQQLAAQTARIGIAQAMRFPSISLTGMLGAASNDLSTLTSGDAAIWSLSGGIFGPIFNFGKNKRRVEIEKERMRQDSLYYTQTIINAFREVEDALVEVSTLKTETLARQKQMKAAQNAATLSIDRYNGGVTSYLEVLDSERSQFNAELAASETYQRYLNAYINLYNALGGGWISEAEAK